MRDIITVTEYSSMRGRYKATVKRIGCRAFDVECGKGPEAAAAKAVELAMSGDSIILASHEVLELLPSEFGGKA